MLINDKTVFEREPYEPVTLRYKVGDWVRISKVKGLFEKGYTPNWSTEVFEVYEAIQSNPPTYRIRDMKGETIQGLFYEPELMS